VFCNCLINSFSGAETSEQGWPEPYIYAIYDRTFADFAAKNTVHTTYIYMVLTNLPLRPLAGVYLNFENEEADSCATCWTKRQTAAPLFGQRGRQLRHFLDKEADSCATCWTKRPTAVPLVGQRGRQLRHLLDKEADSCATCWTKRPTAAPLVGQRGRQLRHLLDKEADSCAA